MSLLTKILNDEHAALLELFNKFERIDIKSQESRDQFAIIKFYLFEHLKKEDGYLYPELEKLKGGGLIGNTFSEEMKALSDKARKFFAKYERGPFGLEFSRELGEFIATLKRRIIRENEILLPKYDELVASRTVCRI